MDFIRDEYINREYSWLLFNRRVLQLAADESVPLLERAKFFSIYGSNLDEFYMVRVGSLVHQNSLGDKTKENKTRLTASEQLSGIYAETKKLSAEAEKIYTRLRKDLKAAGIKQVRDFGERHRAQLGKYFASSVLPFLSPMVLDAKHPLMRFENAHPYLLLRLERGGREMLGILPLPPKVKPWYVFEGKGKGVEFATLEDIIRELGYMAFAGYKCLSRTMVRITRNADFETDEADCDSEYDYDFAKYMREKIEMRASFDAVRLEADADAAPEDISYLSKHLGLKAKQCFTHAYPLQVKYLSKLDDLLSDADAAPLKYPPFRPKAWRDESLIDRVLQNDVFLAYPYDSFSTLVRLLEECAVSRDVASIKITIYRLDSHSRIVEALKKASENGKDVTVVIELCARFDEENNLYYARVLKEAGCTIFYGVGNYKVHSKIVSIVLERGGEVKYITHLGTGNYNEVTSRLYTDLNVITANDEIGRDGAAFFRNLAIGNLDQTYDRLLIAPYSLKSGLLARIDAQIEKAKRGEKAAIYAKMNSLTDLEMIDKFAEASRAGVHIELVVRGICCLRPGLAGKTDNIRVVSIVGRFLEHSRIYCFGEGEEVFISSADLMTRNTDKRVEIATPVLDADIRRRIYDMLQTMLHDNVRAKELTSRAAYKPVPVTEGEKRINSQEDAL